MLLDECITWSKIWTLTFVSLHRIEWNRRMFGIFNCDCWCEKIMRLDAVKNNTSCWCLQRSKSADRLKKRMNNPQHKEWVKSINRTHGMKWTAEYRIWAWIKQRTWQNPQWKGINYKNRWITMCDEWKNSFEQFFADMWPRPEWMSIDRIDNNGNYEPWNCKWSTMEEQNNNTSRNVFLEYNWDRKTIRQWTRYFWVNRMYFYNRRKLWYDFQNTLNSLLCAAE